MAAGAPIFWPAGPIAIRDGTATRLRAMGVFRNVYSTPVLKAKDDQPPLAAVYIAGENTEPNGDANVGSPSFFHRLRLAVHIVVMAPTPAALDTDIVTLVEQVRTTILTDPTWVALSEGRERCDLHFNYPKEANNLLVEALLDFEVTYRSDWPPVASNDFLTLAVATNPPGPAPTVLNGFTTQFSLPDF